MAAKPLNRTVQYWILTDGRTGDLTPAVDWPNALSRISADRPVVDIDGDEIQGIVDPLPNGKAGLSLSKKRDHVPKQADFIAGARARVGIKEGWSPIDDTYVYFCGPANVVATLSENQQSMRIRKVTEWLQKALGPSEVDPEFFWSYAPLIDTFRRQQIDNMTGIKKAHVAGTLGRSRSAAPGIIRALMGGQIDETTVDGITVEVTVKRTRGGGSPSDDAAILDFLTNTFGPITADTHPDDQGYEKFEIKPTESSTEIDLIHQRLTRKTTVNLPTGASQTVFSDNAFEALQTAAEADEQAIEVALETMFGSI